MHSLSIVSNTRHQFWHCMCALGPDGRLIILDHSIVKEKKFVFSRVKLHSALKFLSLLFMPVFKYVDFLNAFNLL